MLRTVLFISSPGLVLFSKQFSSGAVQQPRLVGSLIRTLVEFSNNTTGLPVSYIELSSVAVTIASEASGSVYCALFYDRDDSDGASAEFGQLLANHLLLCFFDEFGDDLGGAAGHNLKAFQGFQYRLPRVVRDVVKQVLGFIQSIPTTVSTALITDDFLIEALADGPLDEVDEVAVLAHVRPLLGAARDMLSVLGDIPEFLTLDTDSAVSGTRTLLWRLDSGTLVLRVKTKTPHSKLMETVARPLSLIRRLCTLLGSLSGTGAAVPALLGVGVGDD